MSWFEGWDFDLSTGDEFDTGDMDLSVDDIDTGGGGDFNYEWFDESGDGSGSNWWNTFTGQGSDGQGGGTNWLGLLMSGYGQYQGQRNADKNADKGREHDIALTILRDQLANKEYDRRQQQLKDAYSAVPASTNANYSGLLGSWSPRPVQQGSTYNGY
jgi:hypothetical protein